jgi:protoporphyrinogen oxidase
MKVIIIGAGPAGLSCASELVKRKIKVEIFEAGEHIGGMARSFDLWGQRVDLGPHRFFSKEKAVNDFFKEMVGHDYTTVNRLTRIYYRNKFFNYPLRLGNVLRNLPLFSIASIMYHYILQRIFPIKNPATFEEWVTNRFGKKLYNIFFKNYSEKLWGISCSRIDADWASQRIKSLSLWGAIVSAIKGNRNNKHKTLVDEFVYPKNGMGALYEKCAVKIEAMGGKINLRTRVKKILYDEHKKVTGIELADGRIVFADAVVSTMPLTHLVKGFRNVPQAVAEAAGHLRFRNTILVYLEVENTSLFADNWIYVHSPEVKHGRITNFRNWCPSLYGDHKTSILCMEFWAFDSDAIWKEEDHKLGALAEKELRHLHLLRDEVKIKHCHVMRVPKCYPVYETGYKTHLILLENYLDGFDGLFPIGRYGSFKYNNQDHSILMGIAAAQKIVTKKKIDLWAINTDGEYQENTEVKELKLHDYKRRIA